MTDSTDARRQAIQRVIGIVETAIQAAAEEEPLQSSDVLAGLLLYFQGLALAYVQAGVGDPLAITRNLETVAMRITQAYQAAHPIITAGADLLM